MSNNPRENLKSSLVAELNRHCQEILEIDKMAHEMDPNILVSAIEVLKALLQVLSHFPDDLAALVKVQEDAKKKIPVYLPGLQETDAQAQALPYIGTRTDIKNTIMGIIGFRRSQQENTELLNYIHLITAMQAYLGMLPEREGTFPTSDADIAKKAFEVLAVSDQELVAMKKFLDEKLELPLLMEHFQVAQLSETSPPLT